MSRMSYVTYQFSKARSQRDGCVTAGGLCFRPTTTWRSAPHLQAPTGAAFISPPSPLLHPPPRGLGPPHSAETAQVTNEFPAVFLLFSQSTWHYKHALPKHRSLTTSLAWFSPCLLSYSFLTLAGPLLPPGGNSLDLTRGGRARLHARVHSSRPSPTSASLRHGLHGAGTLSVFRFNTRAWCSRQHC